MATMVDMEFDEWLVKTLQDSGVSRVEFTARMAHLAGTPQVPFALHSQNWGPGAASQVRAQIRGR